MAQAVADALANPGAQKVLEAPTGVGKTLAYLTAAALSGKRVLIATGRRALQDQLMERDVPLLEAALGRLLGVVSLKGLSNYLCLRRYGLAEASEAALAPGWEALKAWRASTATGDVREAGLPEADPLWNRVMSTAETRVGARCPHYDACFVTRARKAAEDAAIVVTTHHLFVASEAGRRAHGRGILPDFDGIIFDEAHQLESVISRAESFQLGLASIERLTLDAGRVLARAESPDARLLPEVTRSAAHAFFSCFSSAALERAANPAARFRSPEPPSFARDTSRGTSLGATPVAAAVRGSAGEASDDLLSEMARSATDGEHPSVTASTRHALGPEVLQHLRDLSETRKLLLALAALGAARELMAPEHAPLQRRARALGEALERFLDDGGDVTLEAGSDSADSAVRFIEGRADERRLGFAPADVSAWLGLRDSAVPPSDDTLGSYSREAANPDAKPNALGTGIEDLSAARIIDQSPPANEAAARPHRSTQGDARRARSSDPSSVSAPGVKAPTEGAGAEGAGASSDPTAQERTTLGDRPSTGSSAPGLTMAPPHSAAGAPRHLAPAQAPDALTEAGEGVSYVFTSATLCVDGKATYFVERLGLSPTAEVAHFESTFDFPRQAALFVPADMPEPRAPGYPSASAAMVDTLLAASGGGAFVLCTSLEHTRRLAAHLRSSAFAGSDSGAVLAQGDAPRTELVERFRAHGNAVLVGSHTFWEGVDVPGRALRLVIIDKLPFGVPTDPLQQARSKALEARGLSPFRHDQLPAAAMLLKQAFGRLIRSETDRGLVAILDSRLLSKGYGKVLLRSLPPVPLITDPSHLPTRLFH